MASVPAALAAPPSLGAERVEVSTRGLRVWWVSYLLLTPFYVFTSGIPQPADLYLVATFPFVFLIWINRIPRYNALWAAAGCFAAWLACVDMYWFSLYYSKDFVLSPIYYLFNMLMIMIVLSIFNCNPAALARTTRWVFLVLLFIEAIWVPVFGNNMWGRAIGTFNDPNQMGYWTLLTVVCIFALRQDRNLGFLELTSLALGFYIILMSISRSSMLAFACLLILVLAFSKIRLRVVLAILLAACLVILILHTYSGLESYYQHTLEFFEKRAESRTNRYDSLATRSLARLWLFPEHLFLGAGEGDYKLRFGFPNETHSSLAAILFCYGIVGLSIFGYLVFILLRQATWFRIMLFGPPMVYGLANQGVRFSLFWIFLAFVFAMSQQPETESNGRSVPSTAD